MSSRKDRREVTDGYAGVCSQCWRESRTFNPFPSPSTSPHERATLSPTREHTVPTPRGDSTPEKCNVCFFPSLSLPLLPPLSLFFSFFSLSPFLRWEMTRDGRRHRDVSGWNGLLLAIVSVFFPGKTRVLGGMDGCAFSFFFFFPPAFLNEPMEASVERRLRFGLYRLILRCKLNFLEREREGVFLRDK